MRDDNSQQQFEQHEEEQWYEYNRRLLNEFDKIRPVIQGVIPASRLDVQQLEKETQNGTRP